VATGWADGCRVLRFGKGSGYPRKARGDDIGAARIGSQDWQLGRVQLRAAGYTLWAVRSFRPFLDPSPPELKIALGITFAVVGLYSGNQGLLIGGPVWALISVYRLWQDRRGRK
jgi:hypothetical protein